MKSEATIMEGFRYRTVQDVSPYPVYKGRENISATFPVLPIGMIDLWRKDDEDPWGLF
jgi:hypothetical protein